MLKFIVPFNHVIKLLVTQNKLRYPQHQIYLLSFFKSLKFYAFLKPNNDTEKINRLWFPKKHDSSIQTIIMQADNLHRAEKYLDVYELLDRAKFAKEPIVLWRLARALYNLSFHEDISKKLKMSMMAEAQLLLQIAFGSGGAENADVHKWMAIIIDAHYGFLNLENRVKYSTLVKYHLEKACELNPHDFASHYMLGHWCYQICQLNWFQRIIAKYFIASEPPRSDYSQAYKYLSKAEELQPRTMLSNLYLLGSICLKIGQYFKAKYYLNLATSVSPQSDSERTSQIKAQRKLKRLKRYDVAGNVLFYDPISDHDGFTN